MKQESENSKKLEQFPDGARGELLRSGQAKGVVSGLPLTTRFTSLNEATGRPLILGEVTGLLPSGKRRNRICAYCGKEKPATKGTLHRACYLKLRKAEVVLECCWCNKTFNRPLCDYEKQVRRGNMGVYCSANCSQSHHAVKNSRRCAVCDKPVKRRKYCSPECRRSARPKKAMPAKACKQCGVVFTPKHSGGMYCCRGCADKAHSARMKGKGNPHYKDGMSHSKDFADARPLILSRDRSRCVACGVGQKTVKVNHPTAQNRTNMSIHHIDGDPSNNDHVNLILICQRCHTIHHRSKKTPFPWFARYARAASESTISK
jgi:hypothetical protein